MAILDLFMVWHFIIPATFNKIRATDSIGRKADAKHIGKLLVLWRPKAVKEKAVDEDRMPGPRAVKVLKYSTRGGQRPEVKTLRVLGNQRLTQGGEVKRAKRKQVSVKKRSQT
jgi:RNA-binding protein